MEDQKTFNCGCVFFDPGQLCKTHAAAPDMLEALREAESALLSYDGHATKPEDKKGWTSEDGFAAWVKIRAAIDKATGRKR